MFSVVIVFILGYEDGQGMLFDVLFYMVICIQVVSKLLLSVDMEVGYGDLVEEIIVNFRCFVQIGVVGVNFEDSRVINGVCQFDDVFDFICILRIVCDVLRSENYSLFLNIWIDIYLFGYVDVLQEMILWG